MSCAVCLWLVVAGKLQTAAVAVTQVRGTSLCKDHALRKLERLSVLQDLGLR